MTHPFRTMEQTLACYEDAANKLYKAKDDPEKLKSLVEQLKEHGPAGPAGIGLGNYGGHAIGEGEEDLGPITPQELDKWADDPRRHGTASDKTDLAFDELLDAAEKWDGST